MSAIFFNGKWYDRDGRELGADPDPQRAGVTLAASGQVIQGVAGKRIRVFAVYMNALAATNVKFQSNSTDISGTFPLAANGGAVMPWNPAGWMQTAVGEALNLSLSVNTTVGLQVLYALVSA